MNMIKLWAEVRATSAQHMGYLMKLSNDIAGARTFENDKRSRLAKMDRLRQEYEQWLLDNQGTMTTSDFKRKWGVDLEEAEYRMRQANELLDKSKSTLTAGKEMVADVRGLVEWINRVVRDAKDQEAGTGK